MKPYRREGFEKELRSEVVNNCKAETCKKSYKKNSERVGRRQQ
jgi:hypothetical protein